MAEKRKKIKRGEVWAVERLKPNPDNPKVHSEADVAEAAAAIKHFGFTRPVLIDEDGLILAGHKGWLAARSLGMPEVPVDIAVGWSDADKRAHLINDNALGQRGKFDDGILGAAVERLQEEGFNVGMLALSAADLKRLKGDADKDIVVHEVETTTVRDEFWISIRGPLQFQAETLKRMRDATAEMAGVSVQLGVIGKE